MTSRRLVDTFEEAGSLKQRPFKHATIPWLRFLRMRAGHRVHFWPFDGWSLPPGISAVVEVYPVPWSHSFPSDGLDSHQQDAYVTAEWPRRSHQASSLGRFFNPSLTGHERKVSAIEGWMAGF